MPSMRSLSVLALVLAACNDQGLTTHNAEPEVTIVYPSSGEQVEAGVLVGLTGVADDADDPTDELVATWSSGGSTLCGDLPVSADGTTTCTVELGEEHTEITLVVKDPAGASGSDHVTIEVVPTGSPLVSLTAPLATGTYYSERLIEFTGTVSDEEDEPTELSVGIDSSLDSDLDLDIDVVSDGSVSAYGTLSQGEHALTLWAEDSSGKRGSDSVVITVGPPNSDPSCAITAPESGAVVEEGESVLFEATVDDPDIAENQLEVSWTSDQSGLLGESTPSSGGDVAFATADLAAGTHIITLEVLDEVGGSCTDIVVVNVGSGPSISIAAPSFGDIADEGEDLRFTATVSDADDAPTALGLSWVSDVDGEFSTTGADSTGLVQFVVDELSVGDHTVTATVTDSDGMQAIATVDVTINGMPSAPVVSLGPDPADTDDDLSASIDTASVDPEGDSISYTYAWYLGGSTSTASTSASLPASATTRGDAWTVRVTPNDGRVDGPYAEAALSIGNAAPSVSGVGLSPSSVGVGDTITCSWSFSDPDGDSDLSTAAWTIDGVAAGSGTTLSGGFGTGDVVTCTVTPSDGTDSGTPVSASVTIGNSLPAVSAVVISPASPTASDDLSCAYSFSDADGDADASTIDWSVRGVSVGSGPTLLAGSHAKGDGIGCTVTPYDGIDHGTPVSDYVVVDNSAPTLSSVTVSPTSGLLTNGTVTASYSASDPDGDSLTPSYTWYVDGVAVAATGATLSGVSWFDKDQVVHVAVVVSDGTDSSGGVASSGVTVVNTPPDAPVVAVSPSSAIEGDSIGCALISGSNDDDGDSVSYSVTWTVDGAAYGGATTTSHSGDTIPASVTTAGETWACTVTPHDGDDAGSTASASLTVGAGNAAPSITSLSLSPSSPDTDDTIGATATTYDADGDIVTVSYAWYVDGVATGTTGSSLSGISWFDKGQDVHVVATPNDGTDDGPAVTSSTVTVLNSTPSAPSVAISPSSPTAGVDDLVCTITSPSIDADGDSVSYSASWTVDGAAYGGATTASFTGDTVPGSATSDGELWVCTVTPHDGDDAGGTGSASVTIATGNHPPEITSLTVSPTTVYTDDTISASTTTRDGDGDPVTVSYAWYVDGVATGATGSSLSGVSWFDKGQDVHVVATPNDGITDGTPETSSVITVLNTPPGAPSLSISPSAPVEAVDDLVCGVDTGSVDDDGDSVIYAFTWTVDGVTYSGSTSTTTWGGDTVPGSATTMGEVWVCTATPNDGTDAGTPGTASVSIMSEGCPLYVDPSVPPGGDGSYGDPLPNIAYGLAYAALGGCEEVVLMAGTYNENVDFGGQAVHVYSESGPDVTIIDPSVGGDVVTFSSAESADSILEGVTITGGTSHGVYINGASPTILDCVITGNSASSGAGVYASSYSGLFEGNTVSSNSASSNGGGMYITGGSPQILGNWIEGNDASNGDGLWLNSSALVASNVLLDNAGHGIYLDVASSSSRDDSDVVNNTIVGSSSYGVYLDYYYYSSSTRYYSTTDFINNIIYSSGSYDVYVGGGYTNWASYLVWENNNIYGGSGYSSAARTGTAGNISQPPNFTDASTDDFTLTWPSPHTIDGGQSAGAYGVSDDHTGSARQMGPAVDMGAYEYSGPTDDCDGIDDGSQCATGCPVYVDPTVIPGGDGAMGDPYASILYAMAYRGSCDEILLEAGTYDEPVDFGGEDLYIHSTSGAASTIIDPAIGLNVVTFDSGETAAATLEGVTITGGTSHGVYIIGASPTILDCVITGNSASSGAGVYASSYSGLFEGNTVSSNSASSNGGGMYITGGSPQILGNWIEGNDASNGDGLWLNSSALVASNVLLDNAGHGIYLDVASSSSRDDSDVVNNTIVGSSSYGVYLDYYYYSSSTRYYSTTDFINNIIYSSGSYDVYVGGGYTNWASYLVWEDNDVYGGSGYSAASRTGTAGNVSQDPNFTDAASEDFTLAWPSAYCIDGGQDASGYGVTDDIDGTTRPLGLSYDMGAYESY